MKLQETILCATSSTSSASGPGLIAIHDIQSGATLASFKQTNAGANCVAVLESGNLQGGFILASQPDKSILNVYNFQKEQISSKIVLPEKLTCIALDRQGNFCAGGTATGKLYLWEIASGILFNCWDAHYRQVNVLRFTPDGSALVSGSDDSGVNVWSVSRLLDNDMQNEHVLPYCSLSDHTLPVTDLACGVGVFPDCRLLTSSVDHSVKLWDLSSRSLLTTFQFPEPISYLAWDLTERLFFAASSNGAIHQMNLFRERESKFGAIAEAVGGAGVTDVIRVESEKLREDKRKRLITVGQPIASICISLSSAILLVGTTDGLIHLYDIPSHQLLRSISTHKGMPISHIQTMLKPVDLVGHISLEMTAGIDVRDTTPVRPVAPFQRIRDLNAREAHEVTLIWPCSKNYQEEASDYTSEELLRDHAFFVKPLEGEETDTISLKSRVSELESEIQVLHEQLCKAKGINDSMWDTVVQRLITQGGPSTLSGDDGEKEERKKKRSRT